MAVIFPKSDPVAAALRKPAPIQTGRAYHEKQPSLGEIAAATKYGMEIGRSILDSPLFGRLMGAGKPQPVPGARGQQGARSGLTMTPAVADASGTTDSRVQDYLDSLSGKQAGAGADAAAELDRAVAGQEREPEAAMQPTQPADALAAATTPSATDGFVREELAQAKAASALDEAARKAREDEAYRRLEGTSGMMPARPPLDVTGAPSRQATLGSRARMADRGDLPTLPDPNAPSGRADMDLLAQALRKPVSGLDEEMGIQSLIDQARVAPRAEEEKPVVPPTPAMRPETGGAGDARGLPATMTQYEAIARAKTARNAEEARDDLALASRMAIPETLGEWIAGTASKRAVEEARGLLPGLHDEGAMALEQRKVDIRQQEADTARQRAEREDALLEDRRANLNAKTKKLEEEAKRIATMTPTQKQKWEMDIVQTALEIEQAEQLFPGRLGKQRAEIAALWELASLRGRLPATSETARMAQVSRQSDADYLRTLLAERTTQEKRSADARAAIQQADKTIRDVPNIFADPVAAKAATNDATSARNTAQAAYETAQTNIDTINAEIAELARQQREARALRPAGETETVTTGSAAVRGPRKPGANVGPLLGDLEKQQAADEAASLRRRFGTKKD